MKTTDFTTSTPSQDNGVDFWVKMFTPRTNAWRRATLKRLRAHKQVFGTLQETADKIKALEILK